MPPKPTFTREQIASTALAIIKESGLAALTARELGRRLGTSARPIFTVFSSMEEVRLAAREIALGEFRAYISDYREYTPAFKRIGMQLVSYGMHEPELFKLLFMREHDQRTGISASLRDLGGIENICVELIEQDYGLTHDDAVLLTEQLWTQAFALGAMCALRICDLSEEEIGQRLGLIFGGMVMLIRSGKAAQVHAVPEKRTDGIFQGQAVGELPFPTKMMDD